MLACTVGDARVDRSMQLCVGECRMLLEPLAMPHRAWSVSARLPRRAAMDRGVWHSALLATNGVLMRQACLGFGLEEDDSLILWARVHVEPGSWAEVARQLHRFHDVWRVAHGISSSERSSPVALSAIPEFLAPWHDERAVAAASDEHDGDALVELLLKLGLDNIRACEMAAAGRLPTDSGDVCLEAVLRGSALLMSRSLPKGEGFDDADSCLQLSARMMQDWGLAVGRSGECCLLMVHLQADLNGTSEIETYLDVFSILPGVPSDAPYPFDADDSDFFGDQLPAL